MSRAVSGSGIGTTRRDDREDIKYARTVNVSVQGVLESVTCV